MPESRCDVCNANVNPAEGHRIPCSEFRRWLAGGFPPDDETLAMLVRDGTPRDTAVKMWALGCMGSQTDWLLCSACYRRRPASIAASPAPHTGPDVADHLRGHAETDHHDVGRGDRVRDELLVALALYTDVVHQGLETERHVDNRYHHMGHLAMCARMFAILHLQQPTERLKQIYSLETITNNQSLPGNEAARIREAWKTLSPKLRTFIENN